MEYGNIYRQASDSCSGASWGGKSEHSPDLSGSQVAGNARRPQGSRCEQRRAPLVEVKRLNPYPCARSCPALWI